MQNGFTQVDKRFEKIEKNMVRMENKMDENHKALYDGYKQNSEVITEIRDDVKELKSRVKN